MRQFRRNKVAAGLAALCLLGGASTAWAGTETLLHTFTGFNDGRNPIAGLVFDSSGNLYGTTKEGGAYSCGAYSYGVVYELAPGANGRWIEKTPMLLQEGRMERRLTAV